MKQENMYGKLGVFFLHRVLSEYTTAFFSTASGQSQPSRQQRWEVQVYCQYEIFDAVHVVGYRWRNVTSIQAL